jgi:hypothetical protein
MDMLIDRDELQAAGLSWKEVGVGLLFRGGGPKIQLKFEQLLMSYVKDWNVMMARRIKIKPKSLLLWIHMPRILLPGFLTNT